MSKKEKLLYQIQNNAKDVRIEQIEKLLDYYGFIKRHNGGSHAVFIHERINRNIVIPVHKPIREIYIKKALEAIKYIESL